MLIFNKSPGFLMLVDEACVSNLCRAACRVVVEVVVAKLDNWRRLFSGKAKFGRIRKNGCGRLQFVSQDEAHSLQ